MSERLREVAEIPQQFAKEGTLVSVASSSSPQGRLHRHAI
jgi:hypothetical protein